MLRSQIASREIRKNMMSEEVAVSTRDASRPSSVRMRMVITRALQIGQRRRGLLIKTQARASLFIQTAIPSMTGSSGRVRDSSSHNHSSGH